MTTAIDSINTPQGSVGNEQSKVSESITNQKARVRNKTESQREFFPAYRVFNKAL